MPCQMLRIVSSTSSLHFSSAQPIINLSLDILSQCKNKQKIKFIKKYFMQCKRVENMYAAGKTVVGLASSI